MSFWSRLSLQISLFTHVVFLLYRVYLLDYNVKFFDLSVLVSFVL